MWWVGKEEGMLRDCRSWPQLVVFSFKQGHYQSQGTLNHGHVVILTLDNHFIPQVQIDRCDNWSPVDDGKPSSSMKLVEETIDKIIMCCILPLHCWEMVTYQKPLGLGDTIGNVSALECTTTSSILTRPSLLWMGNQVAIAHA